MGLRCLFVAYMTASPRCSRAAHALTSGSCHYPPPPFYDSFQRGSAACIWRAIWSFKLRIAATSAPPRTVSCDARASNAVFAPLPAALATVLCTLPLRLAGAQRRAFKCVLVLLPHQYQWLSPLYLCTLSHPLCLRSWFLHCLGTPRTQLRLLNLSEHLHVHVPILYLP